MNLAYLVTDSARRFPNSLAVRGPDGALTYEELDRAANRIARAIRTTGVGPGDRVGIWLEKCTQGVAVFQAVLRLGAAYVPLDPLSPPSRISLLIADCGIRTVVTRAARLDRIPPLPPGTTWLVLAPGDFGSPWPGGAAVTAPPPTDDTAFLPGDISPAIRTFSTDTPVPLSAYSDLPLPVPATSETDLAYILYTSGSTGQPKGVCISHRNALAFALWAAETVGIEPGDRLACHAPFHFDLTIFDLYASFARGARTCLIPDGTSYLPKNLVDFVLREEITVWYSVPTALIMMMEDGGLLDALSLPLRAILFAGEPFPMKHLKRLYQRWPIPRYLNLYGPTETNVCTWYEFLGDRDADCPSLPIGKASCGDRVWAVREDGLIAGPGEEGELLVEGPTVMIGYWGLPPQGDRPYPTGDLVRLDEDGNYHYCGRRDQRVKIRGHRVELGEIETLLNHHPLIHESAVIASGSGLDTRLVACIVGRNPSDVPGLLDLKRLCAENLPRYMVVDRVVSFETLPRTRNGKVDRKALAEQTHLKTHGRDYDVDA